MQHIYDGGNEKKYFNRWFAALRCSISGGFPTGEDLPREVLYHEKCKGVVQFQKTHLYCGYGRFVTECEQHKDVQQEQSREFSPCQAKFSVSETKRKGIAEQDTWWK